MSADKFMRELKQAWGLYCIREASFRSGPNDHTKTQFMAAKFSMDLMIQDGIARANRAATKV